MSTALDRWRLRTLAPAIAVAAVALLVIAKLGLAGWQWNDWDSEARPAVDALLAGHVASFLSLAPAYGGSLILRAPFMAAVKLWGGGELAVFRAGAAPCLIATGALGVWLAVRLRDLGRTPLVAGIALLACVANPVAVPALQVGHPEELLGAVLCIAAVLAAERDQPVWAGVLLGLAVANKDWALLATGPVVIALPRHRVRALAVAGVVASAVLGPLVIGSGGAYAEATSAAAHTSQLFNPWQLWWFLGPHAHSGFAAKAGYRVPPGFVTTIAHPLIVALTVPLSALYVFVRRRRDDESRPDALLLLALLLLLRCALDPWDNAYYPLPFLLALLVWESLRFERLPVFTLGGSLAVWLLTEDLPGAPIYLSADALAALFLAIAVPAVIAIAGALYLPRRARCRPERAQRDGQASTAACRYVSMAIAIPERLVDGAEGTQSATETALTLSVVIPCLNEASTIEDCVRRAFHALAANGIDGEVIVADNGSTDGSAELALAAGARVVRERRRGYGSAYMAGFAAAHGEYILMADADLTYDFDEAPRFLAALEAGADMVIGNRMKNIHPGAMPWHHRYIGNPLLSGLLNLMFHTGVGDAHCGMRALRRDVLPRLDLRTSGMEFASEMVIRAAKQELRIHQFPIDYHPRGGESKLSSFRDGWRHLRFLFVHSPNHLFILPGALMATVGALIELIVIAHLAVLGRQWDIHALIAGGLLAMVGTQIVCLGACARAYAAYFMDERDRLFTAMRARFRLEHGLLLGGGIGLVGAGLAAMIALKWIGSGFGALGDDNLAVLAATLMVVGMQIFFTSFLLSILGLRRRGETNSATRPPAQRDFRASSARRAR